MVALLASIIARIPWSSLLRGFLFAFFFAAFPVWAATLLGLLLVLIPPFRVPQTLRSWVALFVLAPFASDSVFGILFLGVAAFILFGIKELLFVDRSTAWRSFLILLVFAYAVVIYPAIRFGALTASLSYAVLGGLALFLLFGEALRDESRDFLLGRAYAARAVLGFSTMHLFFAIGALPLIPLLQAALAAFAVATLSELLSDWLFHTLTPRLIFSRAALFFSVAIIILSLNRWVP